jgi:hypothetical protein
LQTKRQSSALAGSANQQGKTGEVSAARQSLGGQATVDLD